MEIYKNVEAIHFADASEWRAWLQKNHADQNAIWLIIYRKNGSVPSVQYNEALDEALCFGWIDSKINKRDITSHYQYFSPRNPKSNWSKVNKDKVELLIQKGKMEPAGRKMITVAQANGTWDALNDVEACIPHPHMQQLLQQNKEAHLHWEGFPKSVKRGILEWIFNAKKPETRDRRIRKTIDLAAQNQRANQYIKQ